MDEEASGGQEGGTFPGKQDAAWKEISVGVLVGNPGVGVKGQGGHRAENPLSALSSLLRNKP